MTSLYTAAKFSIPALALTILAGCAALRPDPYSAFHPKSTDTPEDIAIEHQAIDYFNEAFVHDGPNSIVLHKELCDKYIAADQEYRIRSMQHSLIADNPKYDTPHMREYTRNLVMAWPEWHDNYMRCILKSN